MKAVDYLKARGRMTKECCIRCDECPLSKDSNGKSVDCMWLRRKYPEQIVEIVEKWAKENPPKTYLSVLLEKLPKTSINEHGVPKTCPDALFGKSAYFDSCNCPYECVKCWNREYKEGI